MSNNAPNNMHEGSKDGRQWSNAEVFTFLGFLNEARNGRTFQNNTLIAPTLKKASGFMREKFPQRNWKPDSTLRAQFYRIRDDWRVFQDVFDAPGTEWNKETSSFRLTGVQRDSFMQKHGTRGRRIIDSGILMNENITIDTYANIFCDEPGASRNMMGVDDTIRPDSLDEAEDALPGVDDCIDSNEPQSLGIRPNKPTTKAAPARTTTPKPYRIAKAIPKKTPSRATPRTAPIVSNTMANASHPHPHPEMQDLMVAISDVTSDDYGFSLSLTTAILRWLRKDPNLNSVTWIAIQNLKTKLYFLASEPGFEDVEFPFDLE
ncbi:uncharacterized protein CPUR_03803 [Claviceps purpurea 20.1]|uniref:Myb/SANT-like domain-containing protein n=1 Tax=Claviceps purpurea (strain 20.1) TaxID=1111077 RepID=M1W0S4_CLAP2|nr:uncharacterized protein CPUR_03803 [Claviceps purpurea 20.1]